MTEYREMGEGIKIEITPLHNINKSNNYSNNINITDDNDNLTNFNAEDYARKKIDNNACDIYDTMQKVHSIPTQITYTNTSRDNKNQIGEIRKLEKVVHKLDDSDTRDEVVNNKSSATWLADIKSEHVRAVDEQKINELEKQIEELKENNNNSNNCCHTFTVIMCITLGMVAGILLK